MEMEHALIGTLLSEFHSLKTFVALFLGMRDLLFPVLWFWDGVDGIDDANTLALIKSAVFTPETARSIM